MEGWLFWKYTYITIERWRVERENDGFWEENISYTSYTLEVQGY